MDLIGQLQDNYPMILDNFIELTTYSHNKFIEYAKKNNLKYDYPDDQLEFFYMTVLLHCADEFSRVIKEIGFKYKLCIGKDDESPGRVSHAIVYVETDKLKCKLFKLMKIQDEIKELLIESQNKLKSIVGDLIGEEAKFNKLIELIVEYSNNSLLFSDPGDYKTGTDFEDVSLRLVQHDMICDHHEECWYCFCMDGFPCSDICCVGSNYKKQPTVNSLFHKYIYHNWYCDIDPIIDFINKCNGY